MKRLMTALMAAFVLMPLATDARPLTEAEQTVCRSLKHCLSIIERHPYDSFDYKVLAGEFERFGNRGVNGLLKMIRSEQAKAGHVADLLAVMAKPESLPALDDMSSRNELAERTAEAVRLRSQPMPMPVSEDTRRLSSSLDITRSCGLGETINLKSRARRMPFFESQVAVPDAFGAYRPSAQFHLSDPAIRRSNLKSAHWTKEGWLAAYSNGWSGALIRYDNRTGEPTPLIGEAALAVLPQNSHQSGPVWIITHVGERTVVRTMDNGDGRIVAKVPGQLNALSRLEDGTVLLSTDARATLQLQSDGSISDGCPVAHEAVR